VLGIVVGLGNAFLITKRNVPPFVATLGMLVLINGAQLAYTKGVPSGQVPPALGALNQSIGPFPISFVIWVIFTAIFAFVLAVVFVFLVLAAQFESLTLPLAVIMIVPMCLIASIVGVVLRGQDNNILTQVGFIVLIGLAAKNAILIVEFAKQLEDAGRDRFDAAVEAAHLRLRPILMTSFAFIFGVTPLVWAVGAGAELRQTLGTAVFSGMIGVTAFGLIFTPVFYVVTRWIAMRAERLRSSGRMQKQTK